MHHLFLCIAIVSEVIATTALKSAEGFTRFWPALVTVVGYGSAFYFLSLCLKAMKIGVVYAIWSGVGIVLISLLGQAIHNQRIDGAGWLGMSLIVAGVIVLNLFSKTAVH